MRIHKVIQAHLDEKNLERENRSQVIKLESEIASIMKDSDLSRITFKKGWWIFGNFYRIEVDSQGRFGYLRHSYNRGWVWFNDYETRIKLLKYLMT